MAANTPSSGREQPAMGGPTAPYRAGPDQPPEPPRPLPVALVPATGPQPAGELQRLLRKRLGIIVLIVLAFYAVQAVRSALAFLGWAPAPPVDLPSFAFYCLVLATAAVLTGALWGRRPLALRGLRAMELVVFLLLAGFGAWLLQSELRSEWAREYVAAGALGTALVARTHALNWFALIVVYGVFIPNTWRRCAAVAGALALTPLAVTAAVGLSDDLLRTRLLPGYLADLAVWVATAVAIAVYGSHRIEVLRRQALEARKLGQYRLKRRLGAGGMGEVYLAEHVLLRRPCALKLIGPERAGDPKDLARFEREVRATAALRHPNTVQIYDYGRAADGTFYYVMEYLPGLTLDQLVRRHGPLPAARAAHFLRQVCGALREAHAVGLVHRDVKPGNVMVCSAGGVYDTAKLLDFGLVLPRADAPDVEKLTQEGLVAGTPAYMSPEQAGGREGLDARSDIYSVGALAYFLLTGRPPFAGRSAVGVLAAHLYESPGPPSAHRPDLPADLEAVVLRCLAKDPAERFPDVEGLERALTECPAVGRWTEREAAEWWRARAGAEEWGDAVGQRAELAEHRT
jgi:eukaryotic-like serine/threonine-protein kinase